MTQEKKDSDIKKINELLAIMKKNDLVELEVKHGDDKIFLKRCQPQQQISAVPMMVQNHLPLQDSLATTANGAEKSNAGSQEDENLLEIKSPIVGTFYETPNPDAELFVEVGSKVDPQTVVCIIEAMKVMNEIKAEVSGTIEKIMVTNGQAVEYGQTLFKVKPD